jgi:hypothetical protein
MSGLIDRLGVDVHHSPHYTMPERSRTPVVVTIHDLTFIEHPEWHERSKVLVFKRAIRVAARAHETTGRGDRRAPRGRQRPLPPAGSG